MLEQPPERSPMEIEAEMAAAAQQQQFPPNRAMGCFRLLIWCSPIFVSVIIGFLFSSLPNRLWSNSYLAPQLLGIPVSLAAIYGIGYFDGMLSRKTFAMQDSQRRSNLRRHALIFLAWQFLIVPAIGALIFGACVVVISRSY